jgi:hypothetical protein
MTGALKANIPAVTSTVINCPLFIMHHPSFVHYGRTALFTSTTKLRYFCLVAVIMTRIDTMNAFSGGDTFRHPVHWLTESVADSTRFFIAPIINGISCF